ncbi:MAG: hypothetical protein JWM68_2615 [Verrucomicrobiales bacterium]|nr:hypothetical protein [Verrucomicrobiales bacterium]
MTFMKMKRLVLLVTLAAGLGSLPAAEKRAQITPDYFAILRSGNADKLRDALDHGASVNARDEKGDTALMLASVYGGADCVRLLVERGAAVNDTNVFGATALMRASTDYEKLRLLVKAGAEVNARSAFGNTALLLASRPANADRAIELLLNHGANVHATNNWGASPLMAAVASGNEKSVRALLKHGAKANAQTQFSNEGFIFGGGRNPLMWAAFRGDTGMIKALLDAGADVNGEGMFGTPLSQAAWADRTEAARLLVNRGAQANHANHAEGYTPLHWAASSEDRNSELVKFLLSHGADPNLGGGANVDAFGDVLQTPLMLARRRGESPIVKALVSAGATNETPDEPRVVTPPQRDLPVSLQQKNFKTAVASAIPALQKTSLESKQAFVKHTSRQDCTSCHQQHLPLAAIGLAKQLNVEVDKSAEDELVKMVAGGEFKNFEFDWEALFHPDGVQTKGYSLLGYASEHLPANEFTDAAVHHLATVQGPDGRWYNNLPRPPIQTSDVGATALAVHALQRFPLPGRQAEFSKRVDRARAWLWTAKPQSNTERAFQLLGLAWAGESPRKLQSLANTLLAEQHADGGWSQLPDLQSDAYATGQVIYALRVGTGLRVSDPKIQRGARFLLETQLADGTWHVRRRAFPFQPTMKSGFPHGRDSWISAAGTSWAVMALSLPDDVERLASKR